MKGIGIGISDFRALRLRENYFVDKSLFIKDIIDNQSSVCLITRPRRFGKTLNMSMLKYYFDINGKDNKELYNGLKIMEQGEEYTSKLGAYPVIYITLKDLNRSNYDDMIFTLKGSILEMYQEHMYLLDSDKIYPFEKEKINDILWSREDENAVSESIRNLSKYLYRHFEKPVLLLVDEYDVPIQNAYVEGYYEQAIKFYKTFYGLTFKDNPYLQKTVLTGVSRVAKESIFSGANNFKVFTVLDDEFSDDFGFTEEDMEIIYKDFNISDEKADIKKWYDGYNIGNTKDLYNPWSILNYLTDRKLKPYWVNTSSNDLIKLIFKNSTSVKAQIETLLRGECIEVPINLETIIVGIENNEDNIWGLMLGTGYLKIVEDLGDSYYKVTFPNYEIKELFRDIVRSWFLNKVPGNTLKELLSDLINLRTENFEEKFQILVREMFSYMDVGENTAENFYHAYVLGLLVRIKRHILCQFK